MKTPSGRISASLPRRGDGEHLGAEAGLATAVVAGAVAVAFGGSDLQVSGPTGAMTVVLVPVVEGFALGTVRVIGLRNALRVPEPEGDRVLVAAWRAVDEFATAPNQTAAGNTPCSPRTSSPTASTAPSSSPLPTASRWNRPRSRTSGW